MNIIIVITVLKKSDSPKSLSDFSSVANIKRQTLPFKAKGCNNPHLCNKP
ncbi:hypothetical protein QW060_09245 [Myroides ceti]|uniref:Uncharacterized protein n=1 Tax=Paenimyroides ceti TaxID=395087 RepID=A0ABT8CVV8_9FLAO|nr:hypothetical protein [Paenimyroides ceti]MDN3707320.1 hypothetical protein [Paenimyroides ceti]